MKALVGTQGDLTQQATPMRSAQDLFAELNALDESSRIEAKRARDVGKSIMETVVAFANEPGLGGGYLLLGAEWAINDKGDTVYRPAGLPDSDKVQRDLASQCASMLNVALRPEMQLEQLDGHTVLVVHVPEADVTHKPIYKKASGLPSGAYRRIGSTDQRCVDEDLKTCGCCAAKANPATAPMPACCPMPGWTTLTPPRWRNTAACANG